jgi:hypothetical protein
VTKRHAKNNTGKKGKSATSGAKRRIQRDRLAKKRCKRFKVEALRRADHSSKDSYRLCKINLETEI